MNNEDTKIEIKYRKVIENLGSAKKNIHMAVKSNNITQRFVNDRFVVLRNFIPKHVIDLTLDSWKVVENNPEYEEMFFAKEEDIIHNSPKNSLYKSHGGYCFPPAVALHRWLRDNLRDVLSLQLTETYSYTRKYERGAYLKSHTDRPSCEISATICLDYKTDDNTPWKIWVQNDRNYVDEMNDQQAIYEKTQALPQKQRTGVSVALEVGDVLLYQGPNIPHWRDYLLGDYSYHMFLHFIKRDTNMKNMTDRTQKEYGTPVSTTAAGAYGVHPLDYDGRKNRYDTTSEKEELTSWFENIYMPNPHKSSFVNNYDEMMEDDNDSI